MSSIQPSYSELINHWNLDQSITFLNHGSFGAAPKEVLEQQHQFRMQLENQPLRFFMRELPDLHVTTLQKLGTFLKCNQQDLVFVKNATEGVNTVLSSIPWKKNDRVLITNHGYQACKNALLINAQRYGFEVDEVQVPYPYVSEDEIINAVLNGVKPERYGADQFAVEIRRDAHRHFKRHRGGDRMGHGADAAGSRSEAHGVQRRPALKHAIHSAVLHAAALGVGDPALVNLHAEGHQPADARDRVEFNQRLGHLLPLLRSLRPVT